VAFSIPEANVGRPASIPAHRHVERLARGRTQRTPRSALQSARRTMQCAVCTMQCAVCSLLTTGGANSTRTRLELAIASLCTNLAQPRVWAPLGAPPGRVRSTDRGRDGLKGRGTARDRGRPTGRPRGASLDAAHWPSRHKPQRFPPMGEKTLR